jgi:phage tail sheath protein FI
MPVRPTYPGVYIEEIPSGVRPITGVATSTAAFIGTFSRGLLNEAVHILSFADFEREYGGLDRNSETSFAIQQFFLNGGAEAWVVRLADNVTGSGATPPTNARPARFVLTNEAGDEIFRLTAGRARPIQGVGAMPCGRKSTTKPPTQRSNSI